MTENQNESKFFLARHMKSSPSKGEKTSAQYPGLSAEGVKQAKETAKNEILELIKNAPEGAVIFIGGSSDQARTGRTINVYGDALEEIVYEQTNDENTEVVTKKNIDELIKASNKKRASETAKQDHDRSLAQIYSDTTKTPAYENILQQITDYLKSEKQGKKIVITFPVQLKGFSYNFHDRWTTDDGKNTEYFNEILKKHNNDHTPAGLDWMENQGLLITEDGRKIQGPNPTQVAKEYLESLKRLKEFAGKHTDRPIIIGGVGHQWDLDAVATYLASGEKEVTIENFRQLVGNNEKPLIGNSEMFDFEISKKGITIDYRGKKIKIDKNN